MLRELYDAIIADGTQYDTLELSEENIFITNGEGVAAFIRIENGKFDISFDAGGKSETVIKDTIPEVIEELNDTCWDASDWL